MLEGIKSKIEINTVDVFKIALKHFSRSIPFALPAKITVHNAMFNVIEQQNNFYKIIL